MLYENPYEFYNPKRKKRHAKRNPTLNPLAMTRARQWFQGIELIEVAAGLGGLAAATMIPGVIVPTADTTWKKIAKVGLGAGCAAGAGLVAKSFGRDAAKAAVIGGLAGTCVQALGAFAGISIGGERKLLGPSRLPSRQGIGAAQVISPAYSRETEQVQIITP